MRVPLLRPLLLLRHQELSWRMDPCRVDRRRAMHPLLAAVEEPSPAGKVQMGPRDIETASVRSKMRKGDCPRGGRDVRTISEGLIMSTTTRDLPAGIDPRRVERLRRGLTRGTLIPKWNVNGIRIEPCPKTVLVPTRLTLHSNRRAVAARRMRLR